MFIIMILNFFLFLTKSFDQITNNLNHSIQEMNVICDTLNIDDKTGKLETGSKRYLFINHSLIGIKIK